MAHRIAHVGINVFLEELRGGMADDSIKIEILLSFPPATSPTDHLLLDVLRDMAKASAPNAVVTSPFLTGFTDCHYFRAQDIPCYGFWPFVLGDQCTGIIHGNDERVPVAAMAAGGASA